MRIKSKYSHSEENNEGSWAISYGDMVTLLLSFFVLFFSIDFKKNNETLLDQSLQGIFSHENLKLEKNEELKNDDFQFEDMGLVKVKDGTYLLFFKNVSFFNTAQTELTSQGKKSLDKFYEKFLPMTGKFKIKVQAYTDKRNVKLIRSRKYKDNLELSVLRSLAVVRYLTKQGIPSRRVEITGKGEMSDRIADLLELNKLKTKEKEALSRTISFVITRDEDLK